MMISVKNSSAGKSLLFSSDCNAFEYRDLPAWKRAMELAREVSGLKSCDQTDFGDDFVRDLQQTAVQIPVLFAQAFAGNNNHSQRRYYLNIVTGRVAELDTKLQLAYQLSVITFENRRKIDVICIEMQRMIHQLTERSNRLDQAG